MLKRAFIFIALICAVAWAASVWAGETPLKASLNARANALYAFDKTHGHRLPQNKLATLSIALAFDDLYGASSLLNQLELME